MVKESVHFYQDAGPCISFSEVGARELAVTTRNCSRRLQALPSEDRKKILLDIASALESNESRISEVVILSIFFFICFRL